MAAAPIEPVNGGLRIEPAWIDLGEISQCTPAAPHRVRLSNPSKTQLILHWRSTCGCTAPVGIVPGSALDPGKSVEIDLRVEPLGRGQKRQRIDFIGEGQVLLGSLLIDYTLVSAIHSQPASVVRSRGEEAEFRLTAVDGAPFCVKGCEPDVLLESVRGPAAAHRLRVDWAALDREMRRRGEPKWTLVTLVVSTDHEECGSVFVMVKNAGSENPTSGDARLQPSP